MAGHKLELTRIKCKAVKRYFTSCKLPISKTKHERRTALLNLYRDLFLPSVQLTDIGKCIGQINLPINLGSENPDNIASVAWNKQVNDKCLNSNECLGTGGYDHDSHLRISSVKETRDKQTLSQTSNIQCEDLLEEIFQQPCEQVVNTEDCISKAITEDNIVPTNKRTTHIDKHFVDKNPDGNLFKFTIRNKVNRKRKGAPEIHNKLVTKPWSTGTQMGMLRGKKKHRNRLIRHIYQHQGTFPESRNDRQVRLFRRINEGNRKPTIESGMGEESYTESTSDLYKPTESALFNHQNATEITTDISTPEKLVSTFTNKSWDAGKLCLQERTSLTENGHEEETPKTEGNDLSNNEKQARTNDAINETNYIVTLGMLVNRTLTEEFTGIDAIETPYDVSKCGLNNDKDNQTLSLFKSVGVPTKQSPTDTTLAVEVTLTPTINSQSGVSKPGLDVYDFHDETTEMKELPKKRPSAQIKGIQRYKNSTREVLTSNPLEQLYIDKEHRLKDLEQQETSLKQELDKVMARKRKLIENMNDMKDNSTRKNLENNLNFDDKTKALQTHPNDVQCDRSIINSATPRNNVISIERKDAQPDKLHNEGAAVKSCTAEPTVSVKTKNVSTSDIQTDLKYQENVNFDRSIINSALSINNVISNENKYVQPQKLHSKGLVDKSCTVKTNVNIKTKNVSTPAKQPDIKHPEKPERLRNASLFEKSCPVKTILNVKTNNMLTSGIHTDLTHPKNVQFDRIINNPVTASNKAISIESNDAHPDKVRKKHLADKSCTVEPNAYVNGKNISKSDVSDSKQINSTSKKTASKTNQELGKMKVFSYKRRPDGPVLLKDIKCARLTNQQTDFSYMHPLQFNPKVPRSQIDFNPSNDPLLTVATMHQQHAVMNHSANIVPDHPHDMNSLAIPKCPLSSATPSTTSNVTVVNSPRERASSNPHLDISKNIQITHLNPHTSKQHHLPNTFTNKMHGKPKAAKQPPPYSPPLFRPPLRFSPYQGPTRPFLVPVSRMNFYPPNSFHHPGMFQQIVALPHHGPEPGEILRTSNTVPGVHGMGNHVLPMPIVNHTAVQGRIPQVSNHMTHQPHPHVPLNYAPALKFHQFHPKLNNKTSGPEKTQNNRGKNKVISPQLLRTEQQLLNQVQLRSVHQATKHQQSIIEQPTITQRMPAIESALLTNRKTATKQSINTNKSGYTCNGVHERCKAVTESSVLVNESLITTTKGAVKPTNIQPMTKDYQQELNQNMELSNIQSNDVSLRSVQALQQHKDSPSIKATGALQMEHQLACDVCKTGASFACSACTKAYYCSSQCQENGWATHKHQCSHREVILAQP